MATMYSTTVQADNKPKTQEEISQYIQQGAGATTPATKPAETTGNISTPVGTTAAPKPATTAGPTPAGTQTTAAPTAQTPGTAPSAAPAPAATGSNLPAYAANFNYPWMQQAVNSPMPGANTQVATPGAAPTSQANFGAIPQYDANGVPLPQWQQPTANSQAALDALNGVLGGDASGMDVSGIKNRLKEQALQMQKDQTRTSQQAAAGRGMLDSGHQAGQERRIAGQTQKDILGGFRETDIKAAENATKNKLDASSILNQVLTGDVSRLDTGFQNQLAVGKQQDSQNQWASQHGLDIAQARTTAHNADVGAYTAQNTAATNAANTNLNSYQAGQDVANAGRDQDLQVAQAKTNELLGRLGLAVNLEQIAKSSSRDKMEFLVEIMKTLTQQEQFNAQMGLQYGQMGQNMNEMIATITKGIGL